METREKSQIHLGIIPDGNRRWAKKQLLKPWQGHEQGAETFRQVIDWAYSHPDVSTLTIWGFSTENWNRSDEEVTQLMRIYEDWLKKERAKLHKNETRLVHSGRTDRIPESLREVLSGLCQETNDYTKFTLNFALDYGGRNEVVRGINKVKDPAAVTEESFRQYLDHPELPDTDLIIRTSGEQRLSGFFIWQAAYAELAFIDKHFPELTTDDLAAAINDYQNRDRRFGK